MSTLKFLIIPCIWSQVLSLFGQSWTAGKVTFSEDSTVSVEMFVDKKAKVDRYYSYLDVIVRNGTGDTDTLTAADIVSYQKDGVIYAAVRNFDDSIKSDYFLRQVVSGKDISLYFSWHRINDENRDVYYFKKGNGNWHKMFPDDGLVAVARRGVLQHQNTSSLFKIGSDKNLKQFFMNFFSDCIGLVRLLQSDFYSPDEIESIFKYYVKNCSGK